MTANEEALIDTVFHAIDAGDFSEDSRWIVGVTLIADVLLRADELNRERLLRNVVPELRNALAEIPEIQRQERPSPLPGPIVLN